MWFLLLFFFGLKYTHCLFSSKAVRYGTSTPFMAEGISTWTRFLCDPCDFWLHMLFYCFGLFIFKRKAFISLFGYRVWHRLCPRHKAWYVLLPRAKGTVLLRPGLINQTGHKTKLNGGPTAVTPDHCWEWGSPNPRSEPESRMNMRHRFP